MISVASLRKAWAFLPATSAWRGATMLGIVLVLVGLGLGLLLIDGSRATLGPEGQRLAAAQERLATIMASLNAEDMAPAYAAVARHRAEMAKIPNLLGLSAGRTEDGRPAVFIHYERDYQPPLPDTIDGLPVVPLLCD